jgi:hypothetical protein
MFYFGVQTLDESEGSFRAILSQYHAQFQNLDIHSDLPEQLLAPMRVMRDKARAALEQNEHFRNLPVKWRQRLLENPSRVDLPKISQNAGISPAYHHSCYEFCSSFVHGSLYAMEVTENANLKTREGKEFFKRLTDIVCGYVALAIRDFKELFPEIPALNERLVRLGQVWSGIVQWENIPGFSELQREAYRLESGTQDSKSD